MVTKSTLHDLRTAAKKAKEYKVGQLVKAKALEIDGVHYDLVKGSCRKCVLETSSWCQSCSAINEMYRKSE